MRIYNFNGGPGALPLEILEQAKNEMLNWQNTGMSVMENSHRSKAVSGMAEETEADFKTLLGLNDNWRVLFLQGGASLQFAMVPMNFLGLGESADYINTGLWGTKAFEEVSKCGLTARLAASSADKAFSYIPSEYNFDEKAKYIYLTSNNTVMGTAWADFPKNAKAPLVGDMSSDFLSRPFNAEPFALIHAGAQKNIGPAGLTVVLIKKDFAKTINKALPSMLDYRTHIKADSMYNTPPVFALYMAHLNLKWLLKTFGNLNKVAEYNKKKADLIYNYIDTSSNFYKGTAGKNSRSLMNVTFRLADESLEKIFLEKAAQENLVGLNGHRSVGGMRASIYNAVTYETVKVLVDFMAEFQRTKG